MHAGARARRRRSSPWRCAPPILLCLLAWACGEGDTPEPPEELAEGAAAIDEAAASAQEEPTPEPGLRPFLPDEMQRSTRPESFPHDAHGEIDCAVCHDEPEGHASHEGISCSDCHRASANARLTALSPRDCQSCHHGTEQTLTCEACHESRPTVTTAQQLYLEVWDAPRTRSLEFDHGRHGALDCASCHRALPALTPAESCASCHAEHHTVQADCAACHAEPPAGAHDVDAHLTCSGSGCHRAPEVEAIATERNVCLTCHVEQVDHEPGGDCIECHRVRGAPVAWAAARATPERTGAAPWRHR